MSLGLLSQSKNTSKWCFCFCLTKVFTIKPTTPERSPPQPGFPQAAQVLCSLLEAVKRLHSRFGSKQPLSWFCLRQFFIFGLTKVPFGDYFSFFLGFLSKSKLLLCVWVVFLPGNLRSSGPLAVIFCAGLTFLRWAPWGIIWFLLV